MRPTFNRYRAVVGLQALLCACEAGEASSGSEPAESELGQQDQALCLSGPAFPSCYGSCGFLDCSPIDPGACCACDDDCVARDDCCCDYEPACLHIEPPAASCAGHCGGRAPEGCWCDSACTGLGDCCEDHGSVCACTGALTPAEADERAAAIVRTAGGAVFVAGGRARRADFASDRVDGFLRRVDPVTFATVWDRSIDGCFWDDIAGATALPGGDVVVVGSTRDGPFASTATRLLVRRYTSAGALVWQASPSSALGAVTGHAVALDPAGSLVVTGAISTSSALIPLIARLSTAGSLLSLSGLSALPGHVGRAVAVSSSGMIGIVTRAGDNVARTVALTASGSLLWSGSEGAGSEGIDVAFDTAGELVSVSSVRGASTLLSRLARYKPTGVLRYSRTLDLTTRHSNPPGGLALTASRDAIVGGNVAITDGTQRAWLARFTSAGTLSWSRIRATPTITRVVDLALSDTTALLAAQESGPAGARTRVLAEAL